MREFLALPDLEVVSGGRVQQVGVRVGKGGVTSSRNVRGHGERGGRGHLRSLGREVGGETGVAVERAETIVSFGGR